jgi:acetoin utilization protein AcuB
MSSVPRVEQFMSKSPHTVGPRKPLTVALHMMREHKIRHLPVLDKGVLVGLVTERDAALAGSLSEVGAALMTVDEAMTASVYSVTPEAPIDEVAREMAKHRYGSVVVRTKAGDVVGVLTSVDVCRALADLLHAPLATRAPASAGR